MNRKKENREKERTKKNTEKNKKYIARQEMNVCIRDVVGNEGIKREIQEEGRKEGRKELAVRGHYN